MIASIRLNKQTKTIRIVNRPINIKLSHTRGAAISLKHTGKPGPPGRDGEKGEDGIGVPAGGGEGFVLQKASDADYDFRWLTPTYADKTFTANFTVTDEILVQHNLSKYPAISVIDSAGDEVEGGIEYIDINTIRVRFMSPFSGRITCN